MNDHESIVPQDWFAQGDMDIQAAEILLSQQGPRPIVAFHIQQAIEKYLKGFLISTGWPLRRIHDLEILIQEALDRDTDFAPFLTPCQRITEYYIESRYPLGISTHFDQESLETDIETTKALISLVRQKITV